MTFTATIWSTPQTVTVTGESDAFPAETQHYAVELGATSADPAYQGLQPVELQLLSTP